MSGERTAVWVYAGRIRLSSGKVGYQWNDESTGEPRYYGKQVVSASVGARFEITLTPEEGKVYTAGAHAPRYLGRSDYPEVEEWAVRDLEMGTWLARKALATKAAKVEPLEDLLNPLRELAGRLTTAEKRALAVRVLEVLR